MNGPGHLGRPKMPIIRPRGSGSFWPLGMWFKLLGAPPAEEGRAAKGRHAASGDLQMMKCFPVISCAVMCCCCVSLRCGNPALVPFHKIAPSSSTLSVPGRCIAPPAQRLLVVLEGLDCSLLDPVLTSIRTTAKPCATLLSCWGWTTNLASMSPNLSFSNGLRGTQYPSPLCRPSSSLLALL